MSEEILAVVNEHDEVVGYRSRREIHRQQLRHRAAHVWVHNRQGQILLQKRSLLKDCCPGLWDSAAAGHVAQNENYAECAAREIAEELGVGDAVLMHLGNLPACAQTGWEFVQAFYCTHEGPFFPQASEIDTLRWFALPELQHALQHAPAQFAGSVALILPLFSARQPPHGK